MAVSMQAGATGLAILRHSQYWKCKLSELVASSYHYCEILDMLEYLYTYMKVKHTYSTSVVSVVKRVIQKINLSLLYVRWNTISYNLKFDFNCGENFSFEDEGHYIL